MNKASTRDFFIIYNPQNAVVFSTIIQGISRKPLLIGQQWFDFIVADKVQRRWRKVKYKIGGELDLFLDFYSLGRTIRITTTVIDNASDTI